MARDCIRIGVEVDRETDVALRRWSRDEGRSKRRQAAIGLRRLASLRQEPSDQLSRMTTADVLRRLELIP